MNNALGYYVVECLGNQKRAHREVVSELGHEKRVGICEGYGLGKGMFWASAAVIGWGDVLGEKARDQI